MPQRKKDETVRARTNAATTRADLGVAQAAKKPRLPQYVPIASSQVRWHPQALAWWRDVWESPMAKALLQVDARSLMRLVVLEHEFWSATSTTERLRVSAEIRIAQQAFGLEPYARRRLEWKIAVQEKVRPARAEPASRASGRAASTAEDPRNVLRLPTRTAEA